MDTAKNGMPWAKLSVPQIGSTVQSRSASTASGSSSGPSSTRMASSGHSFWRTETIACCTSSVAPVTTSRWPFHVRYPGSPSLARATRPPRNAARFASSRAAASSMAAG
ncbi:MAG: hypothetical protein AUI58_03960 [Chloroflexi bacterium 13_1_40CM_2_70_6]|nr:MAG: hypothetical protein AUI58_03960 [Chloroflexi bacterium 13_1_40CM_2_70_6]